MAYRVRINHAQLRLQSGLFMARRTHSVLDYIHDHAVRGALGGPYSRGRLASSIYKSGPYVTGYRVTGSVGSHLWYAHIVEGGASVHTIFPRGAPHVFRFRGPARRRRPQLRFIWRGRLVFTPHVPMSPSTIGRSHPGQRGKHFLLKAFIRASLRYRMKLIVEEI